MVEEKKRSEHGGGAIIGFISIGRLSELLNTKNGVTKSGYKNQESNRNSW